MRAPKGGQQVEEKRVAVTAGGGSRRHDDPPPWLDMSLPLQKRRELLDRAIRELGSPPDDAEKKREKE